MLSQSEDGEPLTATTLSLECLILAGVGSEALGVHRWMSKQTLQKTYLVVVLVSSLMSRHVCSAFADNSEEFLYALGRTRRRIRNRVPCHSLRIGYIGDAFHRNAREGH